LPVDERAENEEVAEYCTGEAFEPRCTGNDVIVMLSARYGRMKVGRCVAEEPGFEPMLQDPRYLRCFADVVDVVSSQCSGSSQCTLRVNDQNFNNVKPCYANLKMYLEATYMCISGTLILFANIKGQIRDSIHHINCQKYSYLTIIAF